MPNPFSTSYVRPGAIDYLFPPEETAATLVQGLESNGWQGAIVGPHGAGKSTLLATLLPEIAAQGRRPLLVTLHAGQTSLPDELNSWLNWDGKTQIVVDGYEQLSWLSRERLRWRTRCRGAGLLVTSHEATSLPLVCNVQPRLEVAKQVVRQLQHDRQLITSADVEESFRACHGNVREMLFQLYDLYEARSRALN